jgi:hypothetical protein
MRAKTKSLTIIKEKTIEKSKTNNQKAAKTRRQRGYQWEDTIAKRFNCTENWKAFRLGSPSISLPDVLAVNTNKSITRCIGCKYKQEHTIHYRGKIWNWHIASSSSRSN